MFSRNITRFVLNSSNGKNFFMIRNLSVTPVNNEIVKIQSIDDFKDKVIKSKVPVIVDFFATWCNPCKLLTPRLESIITDHKGKVVLAKVDIDEQTDLALDYDVSSVPVLLAIKDGKVQQRLVGLQDSDKLRKWVAQLVEREEAKEAKA